MSIRDNCQEAREMNEQDAMTSIADLAAANSVKELFSILLQKLSGLLPVEKAVILIHEEKSMKVLAHTGGTISAERLAGTTYTCTSLSFSCLHNFKQIGTIDGVITTAPPYLIPAAQAGKNKAIQLQVIPVLLRDQLLFTLLLETEPRHVLMNSYMLTVLKAISNQAGLLYKSITDSAIIQEKEAEVEVLLSLSKELATVRYRQQFYDTLKRSLGQATGCTELSITLADMERHTFCSFPKEVDIVSSEPSGHKKKLHDNFSFPDGFYEKILTANDPMVFDVEETDAASGAPAYLQIFAKAGIGQVVAVAINQGMPKTGVLFLFFEESGDREKTVRLLRRAVPHLSTALSNVIAGEDLARELTERETLLSLSAAIASVRTKEELLKVVVDNFRKLFHFEDLAISVLNEEKTHNTYLISYSDDKRRQHPYTSKEMTQWYDVNDGIYNKMLEASRPVTFHIEELLQMERPPLYSYLYNQTGIKDIIAVPMRHGNENIGGLFLLEKEHDEAGNNLDMLMEVSYLVSIAVSNILANNKIQEQLTQIQSYKEQLQEENQYLLQEIENANHHSEIIGSSPKVKDIFRLITHVSNTDSTVLILGETGTGKELIARAIHNASDRRDNLMVKVNCAALPLNLIESELFGHEKGSFTGAVERRIGKFELANNGTLFLDEIGELPQEMQVKLLRALQEREIERIGGRSVIKINTRIIAATNRNLRKEMQEGRFRQDLFYRLNVFPIELPPLRERMDDLPLLAAYFINRYNRKTGKKVKNITQKVLRDMMEYSWPGNIRELEHLIERSLLMTNGAAINHIFLPQQDKKDVPEAYAAKVKTIAENERDHILSVLKRTKGKIFGEGGAAEMLGVPPTTLNSKIKKLGIRRTHM